MGTLLNRRRYMGGGSALPYDAEIDYLESTGTQWIDTGIYPDATYTFDSEVWITKSQGETVLWGVRKSGAYNSDNQQCMLNYPNYSGYYFIGLFSTNTSKKENWRTDFNPQVNVKYSLVGMTVVPTMQTMTFPVHLFGFNNKGSAYPSIGACRLGEWVAYSNGIVVADFIPVRVGQVGYMYDKVSRQLFGNSGTGSFILGPDKT